VGNLRPFSTVEMLWRLTHRGWAAKDPGTTKVVSHNLWTALDHAKKVFFVIVRKVVRLVGQHHVAVGHDVVAGVPPYYWGVKSHDPAEGDLVHG
jgi:hypothetical protein